MLVRVRPPRVPAALATMLRAATLGPAVTRQVAAAAAAEWDRLASVELKSTERDYRRSIQEPVFPKPSQARIMLVGWLANAVENGISAYDLRDTLLGPGAKNRKPDGKGGWYNTVPFRHGTPGTTGRNMQEMGQAYAPGGRNSVAAPHRILGDAERARIAQAVYGAAKRLRATVRGIAGGPNTQWGGRLDTHDVGRGGSLSGVDLPKLRAHHKTNIYEGMVKERAAYSGTAQSQYTTFRRISSRSPGGWQHPGIKARRLVLRVAGFLRKIFPGILAAAVSGSAGGRR